jgi:predicted nucleic acid-binding protein
VIVVDASVALQWIVPEANGQSEAESVLAARDLHAPDLLLIEVANALRKKVALGEVKEDQAFAGLRRIGEVLNVAPVTADLSLRALELAVEIGHPVYDCVYLALAESLDATIATRDIELTKRFARAGYAHRLEALPVGGTSS